MFTRITLKDATPQNAAIKLGRALNIPSKSLTVIDGAILVNGKHPIGHFTSDGHNGVAMVLSSRIPECT